MIAIISILASLLLPALESALEQAKKIECSTQLRQIALGHTAYAEDHNGWLMIANGSSAGTLRMDTAPGIEAYEAYFGSRNIFLCPTTRYVGDYDPTHHPGGFRANAGFISSYRHAGARGTYGPSTDSTIIYRGLRSRGRPTGKDDPLCVPIGNMYWTDRLVENFNQVGEYAYIHGPSKQPMAFDGRRRERDTWWNTASYVLTYNNHLGQHGLNVVFLDGHAQWGDLYSDPPRMWLGYWTRFMHW